MDINRIQAYFQDLCIRVLPSPISDNEFELRVEKKINYLNALHTGRLCAEAIILIDHFNHNQLIFTLADFISLVAITRFLYTKHNVTALQPWISVSGYKKTCHLYKSTFHKNTVDERALSWEDTIYQTTHKIHYQEIINNPKEFLIAWNPSNIPLHKANLAILQDADFPTLSNLYFLLLKRINDLIVGTGKVDELSKSPTELWHSIADTKEMLDTVEEIWIKNPKLPVDYRDYLKSHNLIEKYKFIKIRLLNIGGIG